MRTKRKQDKVEWFSKRASALWLLGFLLLGPFPGMIPELMGQDVRITEFLASNERQLFIRQHRDPLVLGPPGVSKSHLVQALVSHAIKAGFLVLYKSVFDLVRELQADETPVQQGRTLARYLKPDLLVIDDFGMKQVPSKAGEALMEMVLRRHEIRSTIMTSNRPLEEWGRLLNDVPAATAILDRFLHRAEVITITGRSYRLRGKPQASETNPLKAPLDSTAGGAN